MNIEVLRQFEFLADLDDRALARLSRSGSEEVVPTGGTVLRHGQQLNSVILILDGRVRVLDRDGTEVTQLGKGEVIGEIALLDGRPASADVVATRPTKNCCSKGAPPVERAWSSGRIGHSAACAASRPCREAWWNDRCAGPLMPR